MKRGFGSIHSASDMKNYLDGKIRSEVERNKPAMRTATVVRVDREARKCDVKYPGESDSVRVPYGSAEPAGEGVKVKIDGPVGARRIIDVIGKTRSHSRMDRLESKNSVAPLWGRSALDYAETFPLILINPVLYMPPTHDSNKAHCSPMIIPRDMHLSRIEVKLRRKASNNLHISRIKLALHKVDLNELDPGPPNTRREISFNLKHIATSGEIDGDVDESTWRAGFTLTEPHQAFAGEVYAISYASFNNSTSSSRHPVFELTEHPTLVQTLGENQFSRGWYEKGLMNGDVPRNLIDSNLTRTIWAAAFPLPPSQGYIDAGGDEGTD